MTETNESNVKTVKVELEVGKETKEVADAIHDLIEDIRAKKDISAIAAENLASLIKAVEGVDMLDDEMKHKSRNATVAYTGMKVADALLPAK